MEKLTFKLAELKDGTLITPLQYLHKNRGEIRCPDCKAMMVKSSNKETHYFKHKNSENDSITHTIQNQMTDWHLEWQSHFKHTEVVVDNFRIDIRVTTQYLHEDHPEEEIAIEIQHSPISNYHTLKTLELEKLGYRVIWIFDNTDEKRFTIEHVKELLIDTNADIIFDEPDCLEIIVNTEIYKKNIITQHSMWYITKKQYIDQMTYHYYDNIKTEYIPETTEETTQQHNIQGHDVTPKNNKKNNKTQEKLPTREYKYKYDLIPSLLYSDGYDYVCTFDSKFLYIKNREGIVLKTEDHNFFIEELMRLNNMSYSELEKIAL